MSVPFQVTRPWAYAGILFLTQGTHISLLAEEPGLFALSTEISLLFTHDSQVVFEARVLTGKLLNLIVRIQTDHSHFHDVLEQW